MKELQNNNTHWIKTLWKYMKDININQIQTDTMTKNKIVDNIKKWDSAKWKN